MSNESAVRHESQAAALKSIAAIRQAIQSLPPDAHVDYVSTASGGPAIHLRASSFMRMFAGQTAKRDSTTLKICIDGICWVTWSPDLPNAKPPKTYDVPAKAVQHG